jgi:hypothetical protein
MGTPPIEFPILFHFVGGSAGVSGVTVSDATISGAGSAWALRVNGQVQTASFLPTGLKVQLDFGDGVTPISVDGYGKGLPITVDANGAWSYTGSIDPVYAAVAGHRNLPCSVKASVTFDGATVDSGAVTVSGAGDPATNQCVDTPHCVTNASWMVYEGSMAAMCM